jgi:hypothetical protein
MGVSVGSGVLVGDGVNVSVGVLLGGMMLGVFVIARNGVGELVAGKATVGENWGSTVGRLILLLAKHPVNGNTKPTSQTTNKIPRLNDIKSLRLPYLE